MRQQQPVLVERIERAFRVAGAGGADEMAPRALDVRSQAGEVALPWPVGRRLDEVDRREP